MQQVFTESDMAKKMKETSITDKEQSQIKNTCERIKSRNNQLLIKMMNLREKLTHQMYMHKVHEPNKFMELNLIV